MALICISFIISDVECNIFHMSWAFEILYFSKLLRNILCLFFFFVAWFIIFYYFIMYFTFIQHLCYFWFAYPLLYYTDKDFFVPYFYLFQINVYFNPPMSSGLLWKKGNDRERTIKIVSTPLCWLMLQFSKNRLTTSSHM